MGWETRRGGGRYYVQKRWQAGRVRSVYIGTGFAAERAAVLDEHERAQAQRTASEQATRLRQAVPPAVLGVYRAEVRTVVATVLHTLGFHQHKRQWRYAMANDLTSTAPDTRRARTLFLQRTLDPSEQTELRALLKADPNEARRLGELSYHAAQVLMRPLTAEGNDAGAIALEARYQHLRRDLAGPGASELERVLADHAALCWLNYNRAELLYASNTTEPTDVPLAVIERWERILSSAQARYLRSLESLARVRRLLKLPAVQVNIAAEGGQQVNVAGPVEVTR